MNSGDIPIYLTKRDLKKASREDLLRLAKWEGLKHDLDEMSSSQLVGLIRWKITRDKPHIYGCG